MGGARGVDVGEATGRGGVCMRGWVIPTRAYAHRRPRNGPYDTDPTGLCLEGGSEDSKCGQDGS